ncbi:methyltransferase domain-containing protein [Paludibaculum fermentans]|uniref:methyltransferase domain-containing protein n=1 Tax=Paludibaculum fermentans TaxID=1473598 RepID=UPI003EB92B05
MAASLAGSSTVVDLGCGSGLDSLIAARQVGAAGQVIGIDFSAAMLARANCSRAKLGLSNVQFVQASAENLPLQDASADHVLINGIFNLNPFRDLIFQDLARVLKAGGTLFGAELILRSPLESDARGRSENWFS